MNKNSTSALSVSYSARFNASKPIHNARQQAGFNYDFPGSAGQLSFLQSVFSDLSRLSSPALSAVVAAILLFASNRADAQAQPAPMLGIYYLENADAAGQPPYNWAQDAGVTDPLVQGIAMRTHWNRVEPHEHANANDFYWDYLDAGLAAAVAHGKKVSISVQAGVETPQWVYDAGAPIFMVTEQYGYSAITDGVTTAGSTTVISAGDTAAWDPDQSVGLQIFGGSIPAGSTVVAVNASNNVTISAPATASATGVAITTAQIEPMPLPWDPIFQQKWGAFVQALGARYGNNPNVSYITMGGPGRRRESYFCFAPYDMDYFNNVLGGLPNWELGVKWIIDQYGAAFPNTPFILAMANPVPTDDGDATLDEVVAYGAAQYPGNHFGVMSCGLQYPGGPDPGSNGAQWIPFLSPTSTVGFCFYGPQGPYTDPLTGRFMLDLGFERGFNFGAHFIETYAIDCSIPLLDPVFIAWGAILTTIPAIPIPPISLTATATSSSTIDLGWINLAINEVGTRIERSVGSNTNYTFLTNVLANINAFTDSGLVDGTRYYYRLESFNPGGFSTYSNEQSAVTTLNSPTSLTATTVSSSEIDLTWADTSASELGYKIERSPVDNLHYSEIATIGPNQIAFNDTGLSEGTKYYYRVRAYNAIAISAYSSEKNATTLWNIPVAPSSLTITSIGSGSVSLAWTDNSVNELGFKVQRKQGAAGTYADIATLGPNVTTYTDNDSALLDGTQYYYQVYATNTAGNSGFSNEATGITTLRTPTGLVATAVSSSQINLTWTDNSLAESGYRIEQSAVDNSNYQEIGVTGPNATSYNATGLSEGTKYYYRIRAYNTIATSAYSSEKNATTLANIPVAPSGLRVTTVTSGSVSLVWTDNSNNETGFKIQRKQGATGAYTTIKTTLANVTTYTDSDGALLDGTQYYYRVSATNSAGDSSFSNEVNGITTMRVPSGFSATAVSSSQINLTWTDNSLAEDGYKIEQSVVDNQHYQQIAVTGPNATSYSVTGLNEGTKYYYRIRAYNAIATSAYSSEKNATTLSNIPVPPSGLTITSTTSSSVSLAWTDNSNNETGFKIQRKQGATGAYTTIKTTLANVTTYTDNDSALLDGTQYYYRVSATNSAGDSSFSNEANGITIMRAPGGLASTAVSASQINLTWTDNSLAENGYYIEQSPVDDLHFVQIAATAANATAYSVTGLTAGTKYYYRVRAFNTITTSAYSNETNATTLSNIPAAPSGLTVTSTTSSSVSLAWTDNSNNETGFKIQRKQGATGAYTTIKTTLANVTTYTDNDSALLDGTQYYYRVSATNSAGDSSFSNEANGITIMRAPSGLASTAVSASQINLTWTDNSLAENGYYIEQSPVDNVHFVQIAATAPNATAYSVTGLTAGTKYYYRVRAFNSITTSAYSNQTNATTLSNIPVPPSGLTVTSTTSSSVSLAWADNSNNETGFKILRKKGATGTYTLIKTTLANVTTYTDNDSVLLDGTQYCYEVAATNSAGDSGFSNEVCGITVMKAPSGLASTAVSASQINLTWTDNSLAEDGYYIEQSPVDNLHFVQIAATGPNATAYSVTGLAAGTKYYYRVRAFNTITTSAYSNQTNATTLASIPPAPSGLTITTLLSNKIVIAWTDNSNNETGFKVQRKGPSGVYTDITTTGANATTYSDTSVTDGTLYYYRVCATNSAGDSAFSNEASGTTPLSKPTGATATAVSSSQINITWIDNSASETGYKIERKRLTGGTYSQIDQVGANVQSYSDTTGLDPNTKYYYRIRATNGSLDSDYSNEPSATTFP
jgi:large repetitive protein